MISEERIKELIYKNGLMSLEEIGKMVAAEAREEGIDELRDVMLPLLVFQDKKVIEEQAERLKEKGK